MPKVEITHGPRGRQILVDGQDLTEVVTAVGFESDVVSSRLALYVQPDVQIEADAVVMVGTKDPEAVLAFLESISPQKLAEEGLKRIGMGGDCEDPASAMLATLKDIARART